MQNIMQRMLGAAKLDVATYEEVEKDSDATLQALGVVVLVAVATGLGSLGYVGFSGMLLGTVVLTVFLATVVVEQGPGFIERLLGSGG